jgi:hypothetical protein
MLRKAVFLLVAFTTREVAVVESLSSSGDSGSTTPKRPMVSLTGTGDVSGFLYGKLQRATSIYGSGLVGPATAIVHGDKDARELLPPRISTIANQQRQKKDLESMLWNRFGMATCEGSVEREDLLTPMSYLKPRLCELQDTLLFLDATSTSMSGGKSFKDNGGGLGGLFSSMLSNNDSQKQKQQPKADGGLFGSIFPPNKPKQQQQPEQTPPPADESEATEDAASAFWLDADLIQSAITRGSSIFVVCESADTEDCSKALADCLASLDASGSIATLVSPDDGVSLGGPGDASWNSLRPQDLEGELSQTVSVRDGMSDYVEEQEEVLPPHPSGFKRTREERLAAAYSEDVVPLQKPEPSSPSHADNDTTKKPAEVKSPVATDSTLSRHDLAEVCVQCALRLPTTSSTSPANSVRIVRVAPKTAQASANDDKITERPNADYFSMMGGPKAQIKAGVVTSVDWIKTLSCFATEATDGGVRKFPKRPDVL